MSYDSDLFAVLILVCQIFILFFSIVAHEVGHGYMAYRLGDPTAKRMGRLTINPAKHFDPIGFLVFLVTLGLVYLKLLPIPIGWAKPVMIDFRYFKNPRKCMALVAIMGPLMNLALIALFTFIFMVLSKVNYVFPDFIGYLLIFGIIINFFLAFINLLPIPPLDGSNILAGFLPWRFTLFFHRMRYVGFAVFMMIIVSVGRENLDSFLLNFLEIFQKYLNMMVG
ncbi:site-2 protease family protein [bacterium]|nr:site-2 protease family protein [bacterium]MBU1024734.1 site-2 protease family protein [bacterium]